MFTGIIESSGKIESLTLNGSGKTFHISSPIGAELQPDQSVAHDGVCLTVENVVGETYQVTAVQETLQKTNLGQWQPGRQVNLERCLRMNGRLDGHIVQGHADTTGTCIGRKELNGSWEYRFQFMSEFASLLIEKGSVAVNGMSLTIFDLSDSAFSVAIIPYTYTHTNISHVKEHDLVNLEFDVIGKYVQRMLAFRK